MPPLRRLVCVFSAAVVLAGCLAPLGSAAADLSGSAHVIDGDTIEIDDAVVRLADIDAPELGQRCEGPKPIRPCGQVAAEILAGRIEGATVVCKSAKTDTYGRHIASCEHKGEDLSSWLVGQGYALAFRKYSSRLVSLEEEAGGSTRAVARYGRTAVGIPGPALGRCRCSRGAGWMPD